MYKSCDDVATLKTVCCPFLRKCLNVFLVLLLTGGPHFSACAQSPSSSSNPQLLSLSQPINPTYLKGFRYDQHNPLEFEFIVAPEKETVPPSQITETSRELIQYFLTALTIPEEDIWVNLSPFEEDRIIPDVLAETKMGRHLLTQDYLLKQLSSSLLYPDYDIGQRFWKRVYQKAFDLYGTTEIPIDTFNKVWIVPDQAKVYVDDNAVYLVDASLKVMTETDYLAQHHNQRPMLTSETHADASQSLANDVMREVLIPILEEEVNHGAHFAKVRQIYYAVILATWYKRNLQKTIFGERFIDQNKTAGLHHEQIDVKTQIYNQYVSLYRHGVFDFIREETDDVYGSIVPRHYFSGGLGVVPQHIDTVTVLQDLNMVSQDPFSNQNIPDYEIYARIKPGKGSTLAGVRFGRVDLGELSLNDDDIDLSQKPKYDVALRRSFKPHQSVDFDYHDMDEVRRELLEMVREEAKDSDSDIKREVRLIMPLMPLYSTDYFHNVTSIKVRNIGSNGITVSIHGMTSEMRTVSKVYQLEPNELLMLMAIHYAARQVSPEEFNRLSPVFGEFVSESRGDVSSPDSIEQRGLPASYENFVRNMMDDPFIFDIVTDDEAEPRQIGAIINKVGGPRTIARLMGFIATSTLWRDVVTKGAHVDFKMIRHNAMLEKQLLDEAYDSSSAAETYANIFGIANESQIHHLIRRDLVYWMRKKEVPVVFTTITREVMNNKGDAEFSHSDVTLINMEVIKPVIEALKKAVDKEQFSSEVRSILVQLSYVFTSDDPSINKKTKNLRVLEQEKQKKPNPSMVGSAVVSLFQLFHEWRDSVPAVDAFLTKHPRLLVVDESKNAFHAYDDLGMVVTANREDITPSSSPFVAPASHRKGGIDMNGQAITITETGGSDNDAGVDMRDPWQGGDEKSIVPVHFDGVNLEILKMTPVQPLIPNLKVHHQPSSHQQLTQLN